MDVGRNLLNLFDRFGIVQNATNSLTDMVSFEVQLLPEPSCKPYGAT